MGVLESLIVDRKPWGISQFALCRGELQPDGSLLVRVIETGAVVETFKPGTWASARGIGALDTQYYAIFPDDAQHQQGAA